MQKEQIKQSQYKSAYKWFLNQLGQLGYGSQISISMNGKQYERTYGYKICKSKSCNEQIVPKLEMVEWADGSIAFIPESTIQFRQRRFHSEPCKCTSGKPLVNNVAKRDVFLYGSRGAQKIAGLI